MEANPGGILTGDAIIDREQEIKSIWKSLKNQSVVLTAERRVGKTSILRKIEEIPKDNWTPILYWVEGKWHPIEFVEGLYETLLQKGMIEDKFYRLKKYYEKFIGGKEIGSWRFPQIKENWKILLESIIEDIVNSEKKVLLMFDELPLMLSHFIQAKECGPPVCMEFLDKLREIRNKYEATKQIAFIFCGSIGIHLIIKDLKKNFGYNADPINNMKILTLSGMNDDGAKRLCEKLIEEKDYQLDNREEIFEYIIKKTDRLPFYIQHVFARIDDSGEKRINKELIDRSIDYLLNDPKDEGFFNHYTDRIKTYYDKNYKEIALFILDNICKKKINWKEEDIIKLVRSFKDVSNETIKEILTLLWNDHYLKREIKKGVRIYRFKYSILLNWWKVNRG